MFDALGEIAFAAAFLLLSALLGRGLLAAWRVPVRADAPSAGALALPLGIGLAIGLLFVLAALGLLTRPWILAAGIGAAAWALRVARDRPWLPRSGRRLHPAARAAAVLAALAIALLALSAPLEWDALSYHLPYARAYAEAGGLLVDTRLRYPLHAHNVQLLYAAALQFAGEATAQLLHAACGALTAAGVFVYARSRFGAVAAALATLMFLSAAGSLLDAAYVDLAAALFGFYAFWALALWWEDRRDGLLMATAFLLGLAAGTKYQALVLLPVFALAVAVARPGWRPAAKALLVLGATGSWWYLRNLWLVGDPFHPLGGPWFGYRWWDAADLAAQFGDVSGRGRDLPWALLPALAFPFLPRLRAGAGLALSIVGLGGLAAWWFTSGHARYLLPSYGPLALMSAAVIVEAGRRILPATGPLPPRIARAAPWFGLALLVIALAVTVAKKWDEICFTRACVDRVYDQRLASRGAARATAGFDGLRLYQLGLENELYLLGAEAAGDWFGPYRYREVLALADDPAALSEHLRRLGRDSLLVNLGRPPFDAFAAGFEPGRHFVQTYRDDQVALYRLVDR